MKMIAPAVYEARTVTKTEQEEDKVVVKEWVRVSDLYTCIHALSSQEGVPLGAIDEMLAQDCGISWMVWSDPIATKVRPSHLAADTFIPRSVANRILTRFQWKIRV